MSDTQQAPGNEQQANQQQVTREALLDSEQLFHCVFDAVEHGILVLDADSNELLLANPALCRMLGYTHDELLALQLEQLLLAGTIDAVREIFSSMARGESHKGRLSLQRKNGSLCNVELSNGHMALQGRHFLVGLFRDLSETERAEQAEELARKDGLTGLYNHRAFQELLGLEVARAQRHGTPVSLLMIDIDHFKQINDSLGHQAGDAVLRQLGALLQDSARNIDQVCRYGGEEFVLILPMTATAEALLAAERLRSQVERFEFSCGGDSHRRITVSTGVASYPLHAQTQAALIAAADVAMYAAKRAGRNRSQVYDPAQQD